MSADATRDQPLAGKRILVTRARSQAGQLSAKLQALGAEAIEIPAIEIVPPDSFETLDDALRRLTQYQWLILTSINAVHVLRERLEFMNLAVSELSHLKIAAVGAATTQALREFGLVVSVTPDEYVTESLLDAIGDQVTGSRVLLIRAAVARDIIPETLSARGARLDVVDAYRNVIPEGSVQQIVELFSSTERAPDAATFTSSSTVTNFFALLQCAGMDKAHAGMKAISIGPITSQTLRDHNWEPAAEADPHDLQGLVAAVIAASALR